MALTKLTSNLIEGGTGTDWVTAIQTSNFTAAAGKGYFVNTTSQVLYVTLPVGVVGMEITIQDYAGTFATNKVILNANGSEKIQGSALEGRINTNNATAVLIYQDATKGWTSQDVTLNLTTVSWATPTGQSLTYSTPSPQSSQGEAAATFPTTTFTATLAGSTISGTATIAGLPSGITAAQAITGSGVGNTLTVTLTGTFSSTDYTNTALTLSGLTLTVPLTVECLVVAGGGGGGSAGGGGGGGLLTGTNTFAVATNYNLTIGAGGAGAPANPGTDPGTNGNNTIISGLFTAYGGGGGGRYIGSGSSPGLSGGSGGGGGWPASAGGSATPSGQGNNGGASTSSSNSNYASAGGGGAGAVGSSDSGNNSGDGGIGVSSSINGTTYYWAGGGGGGNQNSSSSAGNGGNGGGGGGAVYHTSSTPGTGGAGFNTGGSGTIFEAGAGNTALGGNGGNNTGGGGGGMAISVTTGGTGGSGVIILRYPSSYVLTNPGGGLTFATDSTTVANTSITTFSNAGGTGNIQFN